jgi:glycine/D-amino acid oxidase-like deaminating enzyme
MGYLNYIMERIHKQAQVGERNEVAVIGSGIAGSMSAYELAQEGFDVTILEESANVFDGTSSHAIQAHLGGFYSGSPETARECLDSAIKLKKEMPFAFNNRKALFLVSNDSEISYEDYLTFYENQSQYYANRSRSDYVFGSPKNFYRPLQGEEYGFAKNIEGGVASEEPGFDMERIRSKILRELGKMGVKLATSSSVKGVDVRGEKFALRVEQKGKSHEKIFDQVVNAGGYKARLLDHQLGDETEYNLYLKAWNIVKADPSQQIPPLFIVRGDFIHYSPIGANGLASIVDARNDGSYIDAMKYDRRKPSLPREWIKILESGVVPNKNKRQNMTLKRTKEDYLPDARFQPVDLIPGVAVSFSSSRSDKTHRGVNEILPGWQTVVPTKAGNAFELAKEALGNAIRHRASH